MQSPGFLGLLLTLRHCRKVRVYEYVPSMRLTKRCHYYDEEENLVRRTKTFLNKEKWRTNTFLFFKGLHRGRLAPTGGREAASAGNEPRPGVRRLRRGIPGGARGGGAGLRGDGGGEEEKGGGGSGGGGIAQRQKLLQLLHKWTC